MTTYLYNFVVTYCELLRNYVILLVDFLSCALSTNKIWSLLWPVSQCRSNVPKRLLITYLSDKYDILTDFI